MIKGIVFYPLVANRRKNLLVTEICSFLNYRGFSFASQDNTKLLPNFINLSQNIKDNTIFEGNGKFQFLAILVFDIRSKYLNLVLV